MKRTSFIAPVEAMRGNLSGKQDLRYANENNKAFDAPEGRQYARNYRASYIGARRAKDGLTYFTVKTKSATKIDADSLLRMACLGATGAVVGSILRQKKGTFFTDLLRIYGAQQIQGIVSQETSFRKWLFTNIYLAFNTKAPAAEFKAVVGTTTVRQIVANPFIGNVQTSGAEISKEILAKFWVVLGNINLKYKIKGTDLEVLVRSNDVWEDVVGRPYDILNLSIGDNDLMYLGLGYALNVSKTQDIEEPHTLGKMEECELVEGAYLFISTTDIIPEGD